MKYKRIVVKVGSNVLTGSDGNIDAGRLEGTVNQIASLVARGIEVILVSSGAVASGRGLVHTGKKLDSVSARQLYSSVGQARLINLYCELFAAHGIVCGQVLTTKESLSTRDHYLNQRNCMDVMLENGVVPIVNENDTISVTELMFTDNDELSGMVAAMMDAQCLIILSNVDGIYTGVPAQKTAEREVLREIRKGDDVSAYISAGKSSFGRGGMLTKCRIAGKVAEEGIEVIIANGTVPGILSAVLEDPGTRCSRFLPAEKPATRIKKWIAHSEGFAKGSIHVNEGACEALLGTAAVSLLPVGVTSVEGDFEKGDIVKILAPSGRQIGVGKVNCDSRKAAEVIGKKGGRPIVHYDYLYIEQ